MIKNADKYEKMIKDVIDMARNSTYPELADKIEAELPEMIEQSGISVVFTALRALKLLKYEEAPKQIKDFIDASRVGEVGEFVVNDIILEYGINGPEVFKQIDSRYLYDASRGKTDKFDGYLKEIEERNSGFAPLQDPFGSGAMGS